MPGPLVLPCGRSRAAAGRLVLVLVLVLRLLPAAAQSYYDACPASPENVAETVQLRSGEAASREIQTNHTHQYLYTNYNLTTMSQNDSDRKLILSLEPCYGVVYLFVRKNIPCHPDPYSCIDLGGGARDAKACQRTHFMSEIDGTKDGAPTFFQISLSATRYYISVYAAEASSYSLTVLDDVGAWPRRGNGGLVQAAVVTESQVMLQWSIASYFPEGISSTKHYYVYAVPLVPEDTNSNGTLTNPGVFLRPSKVLNSYCGLNNNTDRPDDTIVSDLCDTTCNTTVAGLISGRTYAFNVVVESHRGFRMAYAGTILQTTWAGTLSLADAAAGGDTATIGDSAVEGSRRLQDVQMDNSDVQVVGAVLGSVLGMAGMAGMVLLRFAS